jgi:hypothetical protein
VENNSFQITLRTLIHGTIVVVRDSSIVARFSIIRIELILRISEIMPSQLEIGYKTGADELYKVTTYLEKFPSLLS